MAKKRKNKAADFPKEENLQLLKALERIKTGTLFKLRDVINVYYPDKVYLDGEKDWPQNSWGYASSIGEINLNRNREASASEWEYVIAHLLLHFGMEHFIPHPDNRSAWSAACNLVVTRFLKDSGIGKAPAGFDAPLPLPSKDEQETFQELLKWKSLASLSVFSTMPPQWEEMIFEQQNFPKDYYSKLMAQSFQESILDAMRVANGLPSELFRYSWGTSELVQEARNWFVSSYPLLGAIASSFSIVSDPDALKRLDIKVAAVNPSLQELYINAYSRMSLEEWKFVLAHEFLHAALRHDVRCEGRDSLLWNIACDYVINGWLMQMGIGSMPDWVLYNAEFSDLSCEAVYDELFKNFRFYSKRGPGDLVYGGGNWWDRLDGNATDAFYRTALSSGLEYQQRTGRGFLPEGLIEEIRAVSRPPIPWDVALARWFDENFHARKQSRSYARMSRRQSSTPEIPRPAWIPGEAEEQQIFGVVLDTSGSMDRSLLAAALGSIASYSEARDVHHVRVVFCDAAAYDQGVLSPDEIAGALQIKGRGGTVLQSGIDLLERDPKFPKNAPILIITDGVCDRVTMNRRKHAFLIPLGAWLPFKPQGPVFRMK